MKKWNLDKLYLAFDDPAFLRDMELLNKLIQKTIKKKMNLKIMIQNNKN